MLHFHIFDSTHLLIEITYSEDRKQVWSQEILSSQIYHIFPNTY